VKGEGQTRGKVYLIGAGPGDPELLTLKAVRALGRAEVVLIDDLVDRGVLEFAPLAARVIEVGKRGGCRSTSQAFIERKLIQLARQGLTVARVKGGDPCVFGRGGEEVEALRAGGVAVEVLNGITAGIAAPAALGIPVTHRACSHGVTFVTGHTRNGDPPNWKALAQSGTTLVIYMGVSRLAQITAELIAAGLAAQTPAAIIQNATLGTQKSVVATLGSVAAEAGRTGITSPAVTVIGKVVNRAAVTADEAALMRVA
jgi:uroporphyrin-III C-methyltransferase